MLREYSQRFQIRSRPDDEAFIGTASRDVLPIVRGGYGENGGCVVHILGVVGFVLVAVGVKKLYWATTWRRWRLLWRVIGFARPGRRHGRGWKFPLDKCHVLGHGVYIGWTDSGGRGGLSVHAEKCFTGIGKVEKGGYVTI